MTRELKCKMILDINGKQVTCHFTTTKPNLKEDAEMALKQDLFTVLK